MTNELVQFGKGVSTSIPSEKSAGRFLIETDTGNMYLDISDTARVQIKDSTKASKEHYHSVSSLTDTLPISQGGTGATDRATALYNLAKATTYMTDEDGNVSYDLNLYTDIGYWYFTGTQGANLINAPETRASYLIVLQGGANRKQIWMAQSDSESIHCNIYVRNSNGYTEPDTWTSWAKITTGNDLANYLALSGGEMTAPINSSVLTDKYLAGNQGTAIINSTATGYVALAKLNSTNGYFTIASHGNKLLVTYTDKATVEAGTNSTTKALQLIAEDGNSIFPGTITANGNTVITTADTMTGASSSTAGASGLVPAPAAEKQASYLRGDGTWAVPTNTYTSAYCTTAAATAAKVASCTDYVLLANSYVHVTMKLANTSATALTLNINGKGTKPIYINGKASSTSNYTLPAGTYLVYYDGTNYYFETDGSFRMGSTTYDLAASPLYNSTSYPNISVLQYAKLSDSTDKLPILLITNTNNRKDGSGVCLTSGGLTIVAGGENAAQEILNNAANKSGTSLNGGSEYVSPQTEELILAADAGISAFVGGTSSAPNARLNTNGSLIVGNSNSVSPGSCSLEFGTGNTASGTNSLTFGTNNTAAGTCSIALGDGNSASKVYSVAIGRTNTSDASYAIAIGIENTVSNRGGAFGYKNTVSGNISYAFGHINTVTGSASIAVGHDNTCSNTYSYAFGHSTTSSGANSLTFGALTEASGDYSTAMGFRTTNNSNSAFVCGRRNSTLTANTNTSSSTTGDVFAIGNGIDNGSITTKSNAFRVTYAGAIYGKAAYNTSGADYAEFIKPWYDNNPDNEDRVGYFVTVKDGYLYKANDGDYILGVTSGNPSVVGNSDEEYYWRYERDEFNRYIYEDVEEEVQATDEDGNLLFDENGSPIYVKTGNIIKNGKIKVSEDYDETLQDTYIERAKRPEWDYVGMRGIIPVRDDGTCEAGGFCKCSTDGIATKAETRGFDTYFVIERISDNVISIEVK